MFSLVVTSGKRHNLDAFPVCRKRERNRVALVSSSHKLRRICNNLIYVRRAGVADLCTPDNNALTGLFVYADAVHICFYNM